MIELEVEFTDADVEITSHGLVPGQTISLTLVDKRQKSPVMAFLLRRVGETTTVIKVKEKEKK